MDAATHKRFLEYRDRHDYFGGRNDTSRAPGGSRKYKLLTADEFLRADAEQRELDAKGEQRSDEEEVRFADLCSLLFLD
jgi:hypothetical protein